MKLLEQIIKKYLFESKSLLKEAKFKLSYVNRLPARVRNSVSSIAPQAVKGFQLLSEGEVQFNNYSTTSGAGMDFGRWLSRSSQLELYQSGNEQDISLKSDAASKTLYDEIGKYANGYFFVFGKDTAETSKEKRTARKMRKVAAADDVISMNKIYKPNDVVQYKNAFNVLIFPIGNIKSIVENVNIDKIAINAWKYPSSKGTEFETPNSPGQALTNDFANTVFGNSPFVFSGGLGYQLELYKQLLPIAREMKNTPQPGAAASRDADIDEAIELMESFINDWPDWNKLDKNLSPGVKLDAGSVYVMGDAELIKTSEAQAWDATDSKLADKLQDEFYGAAERESDAAAQAQQGWIDAVDQEYEYNGVKYIFNGKWNKETNTPVEGIVTDGSGEEIFNGVWDENGVFKTGSGLWRGSISIWNGVIINGKPNGYGTLTYDTGYVFTGNVKSDDTGVKLKKGKIVFGNFTNYETSPYYFFNGTFSDNKVDIGVLQESWKSTDPNHDPNKLEYFDGNISGGKWTTGDWHIHLMENGTSVTYVFSGTFSDNKPYNGTITKDGVDFGKYENKIYVKI
jgi:hypothetical protein